MKFHYEAVDPSGETVSDTLEAADAQAALRTLNSRGMRVISLEAAPDEKLRPAGSTRQLSQDEMLHVGSQIAEVTQSGLPLVPGLRALAEELPPGRLRNSLLEMASELERGVDLSTVLTHHHPAPDLKALLEAGSRSGHIDAALHRYISDLRDWAVVRRRLWMGLAYPFVLVLAAGLLGVVLLVFLVPSFQQIFEDFGTELPSLTVGIISLSNFLITAGWWVIPLVVLLAAAVWKLGPILIGEVAYRRIVCRIPGFGPLLRSAALVRFSNVLALLVESHVPMSEALQLAGASSGDAELSNTSQKLALRVEEGETLSDRVCELAGLPRSLARQLSRQERDETLADLLRTMADMFLMRVRVQTAFLSWLVKGAFYLFVSIGVGMLVIALFLPLVKLLNGLS